MDAAAPGGAADLPADAPYDPSPPASATALRETPKTMDRAARLPAAAREKRSRWRDENDAAGLTLRVASDRDREAREDVHRIKAAIASLEADYRENGTPRRETTRIEDALSPTGDAERRHVRQVEPDMRQLDRLNAELDAANAAAARAGETLQKISKRRQALGQLNQNLDDYLRRLGKRPVELYHEGVPGDLIDAADPRAAVEAIRAEIESLLDQADVARGAPLPAAEVKRRARLEIEAAAEAGQPAFAQLFARGPGITWPETHVSTLVVAGARDQTLQGHGRGPILDALGLFAWLHKDALIKAANSAIDAQADDAEALTDENRGQRLREIAGELLDLERAEEFMIERAERGGGEILRRPDADPRALLGILGPPPQHRKGFNI